MDCGCPLTVRVTVWLSLVVVGVVGVGGDVVERVGLLGEVAGAVVLELRGLAVGVGHGGGQAVRSIDGRGGFAIRVGGGGQVAVRVVNVGGGVSLGIGQLSPLTLSQFWGPLHPVVPHFPRLWIIC